MATSGAELAQQELVEEFEMFDNWMDRYQYIIDMGKQLPDFPEERRTEEYKIQGCQSNVWMCHEQAGDKLVFKATQEVERQRSVGRSSSSRQSASLRPPGTGSMPPGLPGWHFTMRLTAIQPPLKGPCTWMASMV